MPSPDQISTFYPETYLSRHDLPDTALRRLRSRVIDYHYRPTRHGAAERAFLRAAGWFLEGVPLRTFGNCRFLDVGCGAGINLRILSQYGWSCEGFEIGPRRDDPATRIHFGADLSDVPFDHQFSYIRVWHVLEHLPDPNRFMATLSGLLAPGGKLVMGLPNAASVYARLFGRYWFNRDIPRHVVNYTPEAVTRLVSQHDLRVVRIKQQSAGGLLGSIQHIRNRGRTTPANLIGRQSLLLATLPVDVLCSWMRVGDCMTVFAEHC